MTRERLSRTIVGWWPDVLVGLFVTLGAVIMFINRDGAERIAIARTTTGTVGDIYLLATALGGLVLAGLVIARRPVGASWAAATLGVLLTFYGLSIYVAYKGDAAGTLFVYYGFAALLINRSIVLARGLVIPRWRDPDVWAPRRRP